MKPPAVLICFCCVVLGQEKAVPKSRYEEDIYVNNHTVSWLSEPLSTSYKFGQRFVKVAAASLMFCLQTHVIRLLTRHEQSVLARDLFVCLRSANQNQWKKTWQFMWSRWSYQHPALLFTTWNVLSDWWVTCYNEIFSSSEQTTSLSELCVQGNNFC